jgi:hypothetical protein
MKISAVCTKCGMVQFFDCTVTQIQGLDGYSNALTFDKQPKCGNCKLHRDLVLGTNNFSGLTVKP